jgi:hypothetical protein
LITGLGLAVLTLIGFVLAVSGVLGQTRAWRLATAMTLAAEAISMMLLCWALAWVWKVVTLSTTIRQWSETGSQVGDNEISSSVATFPGLGLLIGLGLAVGAAYVFSLLGGRLTRRGWVYAADLVGLLLGGLVLVLLVRAWEARSLFDGLAPLLG